MNDPGPATVRVFGMLRDHQRNQGHTAETLEAIPADGMPAADLARRMGLPVDSIEGAFCNHTIRGLDHVVMPGDEVAFVPYGTPGPHRYYLGLYNAGKDTAAVVHDPDALLTAVRARRSIRRYQPRPIEPEVSALLQEAVLRSPTSRNLHSWRFTFVTDPRLLASLATAKPQYADFLGQAPLGVVVCGEPDVSDCWIEDGSIAATALQLEATDLGLGSCWIQIRGRERADGMTAEQFVRQTLGLPETSSVLCIISIGYPAEDKAPRDAGSLPWDRLSVRSDQG